jgi:hypothetical protein
MGIKQKLFLLITLLFMCACDDSSHVNIPSGGNKCTVGGGAAVALSTGQTGYTVSNLTAAELEAGTQINYPLLTYDVDGNNILFFITNQDFIDLRSGYTITISGTPSLFKVDVRCQ